MPDRAAGSGAAGGIAGIYSALLYCGGGSGLNCACCAASSNFSASPAVSWRAGAEPAHFVRFPCKQTPPALHCPNDCRQHKKRPTEAGISGFVRRGVVQAAPLQFLTGYAHGCRSEYSGQSSRWLPGKWQAFSLAVWEWPFPACVVLGSADLLLPFHFAAPNPLQFSWP